MPDYRVQTDIYNGPMDLLLYLIRRNEVDLYDIPLAKITAQYCEYVETLSVIDPNAAGDFLVMAATLMEMKSRMLLPRMEGLEGEAEDLSDPRLALVRQLLEYKRFKDASFELGAAAAVQAMRWPRAPVEAPTAGPAEVDIEDVQIWDLVAAFTKLMAAIGGGKIAHDVVFDDTPIALHAADILDRLQGEGGEMLFENVFLGRDRIEMIGLFLALLELMRQQRVQIKQSKTFGPIRIILLSAEPIQVAEEAGPAFRAAVLGTEHATKDAQATMGLGDAAEKEAVDAAAPVDQDEDAEAEKFEELDRIKTDVDMDAILRQASEAGRSADPPPGDAQTPSDDRREGEAPVGP